MAVTIQADGLCSIKVVATASGSLALLGYTENQADLTERLFTGEVHGDENGGDQGPPIDIQYFGEMHIVRMLLTKYDEAIADTIRAGVAGGTAGTPSTSGSLYFQGGLDWRLLLHTVNRPRNYLRAIFDEPKEINKGTKHSKLLVVAKCYKNNAGVLYNSTTTG